MIFSSKKFQFLFLASIFLNVFSYFPSVFAEKNTDSPPQEWNTTITFSHEFSNFRLPLTKVPNFFQREEQVFFRGQEIIPSAFKSIAPENAEVFSIEEDGNSSPFPVEKHLGEWRVDQNALNAFLEEYVLPHVEQETQDVRIFRGEGGDIQFEGAGMFGKVVDREKTRILLETALKEGVDRVELPVTITSPKITVDDEELSKSGISDLVSVGESDFSGSSWARMQNVEVGSLQLNGYLIPEGETGSFNDALGPVDADHGYLPELVIVGSRLDKEYGGGLCQVSSTAFRAALLAGLPIAERYPHSFAVSYYEPWGTDATIYPGNKDFKFVNDTKGAILVQTTMNRETKKLRFHFYGTRDDRQVKLLGPTIGRHVAALPALHQTSEKLAPGETQWLSKAVEGFDASWTRIIFRKTSDIEFASKESAEPLIYSFFSRYQPRRNWSVTGVSPASAEASDEEVSVI